MASSAPEITLLLRAKFLAQGAVDSLSLSLDKVKDKAADVKRGLGELGSSLSAGLGNLTENLLTGQDFGQAATNLGAFLAGETVQEFGTSIIQKMAGSAVVQAIGGALGTLGSSIGGLISAAIPAGMALAPVLILAAIVAAIAFLIANPEIRDKVLGVAGDIVHGIVGGLVGLGAQVVGLIIAAPGVVADVVGGFVGSVVGWFLGIPLKLIGLGASIVGAIIGGMLDFPGKVWAIVQEAFAKLDIRVGPFHITGHGITIDLPAIDDRRLVNGGAGSGIGESIGKHAGGGWAGLHGPELSWLGEKGPEYVVSNDELRAGGSSSRGVTIEGVSESELIDIVERGLFVRLRLAPAAS